MPSDVPGIMPEFHSILVPVDGSPAAGRALKSAIDLAKFSSARLSIVGVVPTPRVYSDQAGAVTEVLAADRLAFQGIVDKAIETARTLGVSGAVGTVREGPVVDAILAYVDEQHADLVVMGARGLSRAGRILLGSVSDGVAHHATCSVLLVRATAPTEPPK
jgi:nucleotide-binding universal stress UspA family protein